MTGSKPLLNKTKQQFVEWFRRQDERLIYDLATTPFSARTELARFRRLYLRLLNNRNHKEWRKS